MNRRIAAERLENQRLTRPRSKNAEDVVAWFGAIQAQEYPPAKWAIALRMAGRATSAAIERVFNSGRILRTHVLRPTWHFVAAADLPWMLELTAPRVHRALAFAYRYYELDSAMRTRAAKVIERAFRTETHLTRTDLGAHLSRAGMAVNGVRLALVTVHAELEGVICSGPQLGTQASYALLASRATNPRRLSGDEALGELTRCYFRSHGPATLRDFVWWSGLLTTDARRGLDIVRGKPDAIDGHTYWTIGQSRVSDNRAVSVHLLSTYDEYLVAYRDLAAVPRAKDAQRTLQQTVVVGGEVAGTWKAARRGDEVAVQVAMFRRLTSIERRGLDDAVERYGRFLEAPVSLHVGRV